MKNAVAVPRQGGALVKAKWEKEMAALAVQEAEKEVLTGQFISIKGGVMTLAGQRLADNKVKVVVIDHIFENAYYVGKYDPDNPSPPVCFAFGREEEAMVPHDDSAEKQNDACGGCPMNAFNSDPDGGKGKACKNGRRLALLSASELTPEAIKRGEIAYLKVPPTSLKGWAYYLKALAGTYQRPAFGVVTEIGVVPDPQSQVRVTFNMVEVLDPKVVKAIMERRQEVAQQIDFPYKPGEVAPAQPRRAAPRKPARRQAAPARAAVPAKKPARKAAAPTRVAAPAPAAAPRARGAGAQSGVRKF